jgi:acyl-homoserine-lactone acylase
MTDFHCLRAHAMPARVIGLLFALGAGSAAVAAEFTAEVRRTSYGVAHIKADDEKGIGYGVGYAYAQDNFCLLAEDVITVNGERSKHFGPDTLVNLDGSGIIVRNLPADFHYRIVNDAPLVQAAWDQQPLEIKHLLLGYAAGVNRYLSETGAANLPEACRGKPWVRPMTELDAIRMIRRFALAGGSENFIEAEYAAQPPAAGAADKADTPAGVSHDTPAPAGIWKKALRRDATLGSNGVALGREATASGKGMLLANPHFPWTSPYRFWQLHLTIPGKVDAIGASLSGLPVVNIGHNGHVAWTHTVNTSAHFTLFKLELERGDPTRYVVEGVSRPMRYRDLTVDVGGGATAARRFWFTHEGPLVVLPGLLEWSSRTAYAMRDANADNQRLFEQWWAYDKSRSLDEYKSALETILGIPWVHSIAVDAAGNAYYGDISVVPKVTADQQAACVPLPFRPLVADGLFILDGATSACAWGNTAGTPQRGIFSAAELPSLTRTDWVQNSNDSAWLTHPSQPLTGYPDIVSIDGTEQGGRTRIGIEQIRRRLAGTDGLPGRKFTLGTLQQLAFSNRSLYASVLLEDLQAVCAAGTLAPSGADISRPCATLAAWSGTAEVNAIGWPLFHAWRESINASGVDYWAVPFIAAAGVATPRGLKKDDPTVAGAAREALATAVIRLREQGLDWALPWGQLQVAVRGNERIPIHGGHGSDIYNAIYNRPVGDGLFDVSYGSSHVFTVSFETSPPITQGWLTYSQSTNPASPHYADQTRLFSSKKWITYPYTDAQIRADPNYSTKTIRQ